jgi:phosphoglycerate dehydrogenase-like enzyme
MHPTSGRLRVVVATPLTDELGALITKLEPRIDLVCEQDLLPPMRWPGDHDGDPQFRRAPQAAARFEQLVDSAEALYGIPDTDPVQLQRTAAANPALRWVHTMAAGGGAQVKAADLAKEDLERIVFTTSAGPHSGPLAEFAVFGVLAGAKSLPRLQAQKASRTWSGRWLMQQVEEMTVAVVGLGSIGRGITQRFRALGATVIGVNRSHVDAEGVETIYLNDQLVEAVARADAIVSALPGTDRTHKMIGRDMLAAVKPGVVVVNVGRGTVVDEEALVEALEDGRVAFAALDVFYTEPLPQDSPLWGMDNVLIAPHTAALHVGEDRLIAELFAANATRLLDGRPLENEMDPHDFY